MTDLAFIVRAARLAQNLTRDELANVTGLSPKFITHVEAGKPTAQIGKVLQLLDELGVRLHAQPTTAISTPLNEKGRKRRQRTQHDK
ncbi:helix-turn-helix transcriptional regulator [Paraburkholderia sp. D15]|uniref:helix-turn-helix domain-containing protein n=1 Tax=Paraburkholderia sp. D15 TaxID=2880218 RepID=UPI00247AB82A|nr:helix-turn-helix transcriptional regulator [Paraburkholderia sp. D15]WGS51833.1 helix-turn-helix transcriptional regulator [Paraburkholderia sp. D15]